MLACEEREAMVMAPPTMHDSAVSPCFNGCPAFSTGISHHSLLPHIPSIRLSTINRRPHPGIAPQSLNYSSQPMCLLGMYGCGKHCLILNPFRLPQISCCTLSFKWFSPESDNCPRVGIRPMLQFPHLPRAGPVLLTLLFFPLVPCPT